MPKTKTNTKDKDEEEAATNANARHFGLSLFVVIVVADIIKRPLERAKLVKKEAEEVVKSRSRQGANWLHKSLITAC